MIYLIAVIAIMLLLERSGRRSKVQHQKYRQRWRLEDE